MPTSSAASATTAAIKAALASPTQCSADTVAALRDHLRFKTSVPAEATQQSAGKRNGAGRPLVATKQSIEIRRPRATTGQKSVASSAKIISIGSSSPLSQREQTVLATAVVNAVLQSLNEAVKAARSGQSPNKQLSDRSPNSIPTRVGKDAGTKLGSQKETQNGLSILADCGSLAFSFLCQQRGLKEDKTTSKDAQLLTGMMAFVGKLISLRMEAAAIRELAAVKVRFVERPSDTSSNLEVSRDSGLAALLDVNCSGTDARSLLILSYQILVMRTIAISSRMQDVHVILSILSPDCASSPFRIIEDLISSTTNQEELVSQIEALSRITWQLAETMKPRVKTAKTKFDMGPFITLSMIALESRVKWMTLAGHVPDLSAELIVPFERCLLAVLQWTSEVTTMQYSLIIRVLTKVLHFPNVSQPKETGQLSNTSLFTSLSHLAERAGLAAEAEKWIREVTGHSIPSGNQDYTIILHRIRLAVVKLLKEGPGYTAEHSLETLLLQAKDGTNKISLAADVALQEVLLLKKTAVQCWLRFTSAKLDSSKNENILVSCQSALSICVNFFTCILKATTCPKAILKPEKLRTLALSTVGAALATCKPLDGEFLTPWDSSDSLLQDCLALAKLLGPESMTTSGGMHLLVTISNLYWHAASEQSSANSPSDAVLCRQRACDVLLKLQQADKSAGHLAYKLHRLASHILSTGQTQKAFAILEDAIRESVEESAFADAARQCDTLPLAQVSLIGQSITSVTKSLKTLMEWNIEHHTSSSLPTIFDLPERALEERGLLLETQLQQLIEMPLITRSQRTHIKSTLTCVLASKLNDIYASCEYPIRRLRANLNVITVATSCPEVTTQEPYRNAVALCKSPLPALLARDVGLERFKDHMQTSAHAMAVLEQGNAAVKDLCRCLETWSSMLSSIENMDMLKEHVENVGTWISQLYAIFHFLGMHGLEKEQIAVADMLTRVLEVSHESETEVGDILAVTASNLLQLGYSSSAGVRLGRFQSFQTGTDSPVADRVLWNLVHAEYALGLGSLQQYQAHLDMAQAATVNLPQAKRQLQTVPLSVGLKQSLYSADAFRLHALRELQYGDPVTSLMDMKKCISLLQHIWATVEGSSRDSVKTPDETAAQIEEVTESLTSLRLEHPFSKDKPATVRKKVAQELWSIIPRLHRALLTAAQICEHCGMYQESLYFYERATKFAIDIDSKSLLLRSLIQQGDCFNRSGRLDDGMNCLQKAASMQQDLDITPYTAMHHRSLGFAEHVQGRWQDEMDAYEQAEAVVNELIAPEYVRQLNQYAKPSTGTLTSARANSTIQVKKAAKPRRPTKTGDAGIKPTNDDAMSGAPQLTQLLYDIHRRKAESLLAQGDLEIAANAISADLPQSKREQLYHKTTRATLFFLRANKALSLDSVLAMMAESTLAFPATSLSGRRRSSVKGPVNRSGHVKLVKPNPKAAPGKFRLEDSFEDALQELSEVLFGSGHEHHQAAFAHACSIYVRAGMLHAYAGVDRLHLQPTHLAHALESSKNSASITERNKARLENENIQRGKPLPWPEHSCADVSASVGAAHFQQMFIDIIPKTWTAISMSLSEDSSVLYLVRYVAGRAPMIIQLPLARQDSDGLGEEPFTFEDGRSELLHILKESDSTVHIARDDPQALSVKGAKTKWWSQREELDRRLHELLINIEHVWLGGFRGIFWQPPRHKEALARFRQTFENILRNHLPSRNRSQKHITASEVALDAQIFELFVGLAHPGNDDLDLDEPLSDLLYFVVDILQFHGEANAYDEIDFDSMSVDTQDALHSYHDAVKELGQDPSPNHTILILDKRLHAFPLESLPCLTGRSVSRVMSLVDMRERILAMKPRPMSFGLVASKEKGTYILNSSLDLRKTQARFESKLRTSTHTKDWTSIIGRKPSEAEFLAGLAPSPDESKILLYFGHGSGAQYVRSKCIKRLQSADETSPSCNTALLFGCSSCSLTEAGEFEPYGVPKTYLTAGAPAVLGSLWDVTDGDCDVFAGGVLERWGLVPPGSFVGCETAGPKSKAGTGAKGSSKTKASPAEARTGQMSLSDAVAQSRADCYLPYLNGAAMIVYGVPVYLS